MWAQFSTCVARIRRVLCWTICKEIFKKYWSYAWKNPQNYKKRMADTVYVDVSAKIEDWAHDSVIAIANDQALALLIQANTKTAAARLVADGDPVQFTLLALFTCLAIRTYPGSAQRIVIDQDYSGEAAARIIRRKLTALLRREDPNFKGKRMNIKSVKGSQADRLARAAYKKRAPVNGEITLADVISVMGK